MMEVTEMDLMEQAPQEICNKIDVLGRRFLKQCGYKITNFNDKRQVNRVLNRMDRNGKELTHRQFNKDMQNIYFWYELVDKNNHKNVFRKSDVLHFTFNEMDYVPETETESFEVDPYILQKMIEEGGV